MISSWKITISIIDVKLYIDVHWCKLYISEMYNYNKMDLGKMLSLFTLLSLGSLKIFLRKQIYVFVG
jgi:hypothetical protein